MRVVAWRLSFRRALQGGVEEDHAAVCLKPDEFRGKIRRQCAFVLGRGELLRQLFEQWLRFGPTQRTCASDQVWQRVARWSREGIPLPVILHSASEPTQARRSGATATVRGKRLCRLRSEPKQ